MDFNLQHDISKYFLQRLKIVFFTYTVFFRFPRNFSGNSKLDNNILI